MHPALNPAQQPTLEVVANGQRFDAEDGWLLVIRGNTGLRGQGRGGLVLNQRKLGGQQCPLHRADFRHRRQQGLGVRLPGRLQHRIDGTLLNSLTAFHDHDLVGHLGHHAHVMGNEDNAHGQVALQLFDDA